MGLRYWFDRANTEFWDEFNRFESKVKMELESREAEDARWAVKVAEAEGAALEATATREREKEEQRRADEDAEFDLARARFMSERMQIIRVAGAITAMEIVRDLVPNDVDQHDGHKAITLALFQITRLWASDQGNCPNASKILQQLKLIDELIA